MNDELARHGFRVKKKAPGSKKKKKTAARRRSDTRPLWVADCETDPFEYGEIPRPFIWGVYNGVDYWEFGTPDLSYELDTTREFIEFVRDQRIALYAHNGGKFDWHFISPWFEPGMPILVINGRLAKFTIGKCEFRDSFNLLPVSLDQYQKTPFEYWKMHKSVRADYADEIRPYLRDDCVNLWNMVAQFENEYGRNLTQASAALKKWSQMSGRNPPKSSEAHYERFKPFYYGGRVQCFESGELPINAKSIDINSAYPFAMMNRHPFGLEVINHDGERAPALDNMGPCFFEVECVARGCFPYRTTNFMLYYPSDNVRRVYYVTGWELKAAIETNTIDPEYRIIRWYEIPKHIDFSDYVRHFWQKRKEAKRAKDKGADLSAKIFLNGLYGKFAADPREYRNCELHARDEWAELITEDSARQIQEFKEWLLVSEPLADDKMNFYNLATAASITGFVRAYLWRHILKAKRPLYCDTDSITAVDFSGVDFGSELGQWEIEGEYDRVIICGKKLYAFHYKGRPMADNRKNKMQKDKNWKLASKGVDLGPKDIAAIAAGQTVQYRPDVPTFSVHKTQPTFTPRRVKMTSADITAVPREIDPLFCEPVQRGRGDTDI